MSEFRYFAFSEYAYRTNHSQNLVSLPISQFHPTKRTTTDEISHELNVPYTVFEVLVAIFAIVGNLMVIIVFQRERKLRRRTNYYIVSLAMADFLVGSLGVPFAVLASIGLPTNLFACLFTVSLLVVLCTISIFCLVAVSVDRYWAILYPMAYSRNVRTKTAIIIISMCWVAGTVVGFLPLFGWHADVGPNQACLFVEVMDYNYLVFLYFATIITPALLMLAFYAHIYRVIVKQVRQIVTMNPLADSRRSSTAQINFTGPIRPCHGGTMLRVLGAARKRDVKATQNLSIIVLFFMICWIPLYTINCIKAFCPDCYVHPKLTLFCIILSHLNSAVNPVLYAYHLKDFRAALKNLILKIMGVDVEQPIEAIHRFSMASQHRLQSLDTSMRNSLQPRIYIDSPIWLRQQQQQALKNPQLTPKCGVVTPCLNNIHQTVAAVASVTTDIEREMWNIAEASSGAELGEINYEFPEVKDEEDSPPTPPPRRHHRQRNQMRRSATQAEGCDSPYSYDNRNYSTTPEEPDFDEVFLPMKRPANGVDHKELKNSLIACAMRDKLRSDNTDYQVHKYTSQHALPDANPSDYELPQETESTPNGRIPKTKSPTPPQDNDALTTNACTSNSNCVYVINKDASPLSPGRKPKFKKAAQRTRVGSKNVSRTCSCNSECSTPTQEGVTSPQNATTLNIMHSNSNSIENLNNIDDSKAATRITTTVPTTNNNNSHMTNNLNYYTFHQIAQQTESQSNKQQQANLHQPPQQQEVKISPLKSMSDFIFSPIVKHSSLFHLFDGSTTAHESTTTSSTSTNATRQPVLSQNNSIEDSTVTMSSEIIVEPSPTLVNATKS